MADSGKLRGADGLHVGDVVGDFLVCRAISVLDTIDVYDVCDERLQKYKAHAKSDEFVQVFVDRKSLQGVLALRFFEKLVD